MDAQIRFGQYDFYDIILMKYLSSALVMVDITGSTYHIDLTAPQIHYEPKYRYRL